MMATDRHAKEHPEDIGWQAADHLLPAWLGRMGAVAGLVALAAIAFAAFRPVEVLPRLRLAPGFSLIDQDGETFTSEDGRGAVTLYSFGYGSCGDRCAPMLATVADVARRSGSEIDLGSTLFRLVTVSLDPTDRSRLAQLAETSGADGDRWKWVSGSGEGFDLLLRSGFGVPFERSSSGIAYDPWLVLVDASGVVRGEYRHATHPGDADRLIRHIGLLGAELHHAHGVASVAYEAAHASLRSPMRLR